MLQQQIPATGITTALDHLQTSYAVSQQIAKEQTVPVRNDPPRIVFGAQPTVLVPVDGDPVLGALQNAPGFQRVINTRALFLQDQAGTMYINAAGFWYEARAVAGPWLVLASPPADAAERGAGRERRQLHLILCFRRMASRRRARLRCWLQLNRPNSCSRPVSRRSHRLTAHRS